MLNRLNKMRSVESEDGFTLIELMIVVVIIGILAAIAIPIFMNQQKAAIQASIKNDVRNTNANVIDFLVKHPKGNVYNHSDDNISDSSRPYLVQSRDNIVAVYGDWTGYQIIGKDNKRTYECVFNSPDGKLACRDL